WAHCVRLSHDSVVARLLCRHSLLKKDPAEYCIGTAIRVGNPEYHVAAEIPHKVHASAESGDRPGVEHVIVRIQDVHALRAPAEVPVEHIQRHLVRDRVLETEIDG